jgi:hypothetical protein
MDIYKRSVEFGHGFRLRAVGFGGRGEAGAETGRDGRAGHAEHARDRLGPVRGARPGEYLPDVPLDRGLADDQLLGDRGVGQAVGNQAQDLQLPLGQPQIVLFPWRGLAAHRELLELEGTAAEVRRGALEGLLREPRLGDVLHDAYESQR